MNTYGFVTTYKVDGGDAWRFWIHPRVMIGGDIVDPYDRDNRVSALYGVTHVLSVDGDRDNEWEWAASHRARFGWPDDGRPFPVQTMIGALTWARAALSDARSVIYLHCHMGGSRSVSTGMGLLRLLGMTDALATEIVRASRPQWPDHAAYRDVVNAALTAFGAR